MPLVRLYCHRAFRSAVTTSCCCCALWILYTFLSFAYWDCRREKSQGRLEKFLSHQKWSPFPLLIHRRVLSVREKTKSRVNFGIVVNRLVLFSYSLASRLCWLVFRACRNWRRRNSKRENVIEKSPMESRFPPRSIPRNCSRAGKRSCSSRWRKSFRFVSLFPPLSCAWHPLSWEVPSFFFPGTWKKKRTTVKDNGNLRFWWERRETSRMIVRVTVLANDWPFASRRFFFSAVKRFCVAFRLT